MRRLLALALLTWSLPVSAAEEISLSGTLDSVFCTQACGTCCGTSVIQETSGELRIPVGNSFVSLTGIRDTRSIHRFTGRYYDTNGQCGVGQCKLFQIESVDQSRVSEPSYDTDSETLTLPSAVIGGTQQRYLLQLLPPYNIRSLVNLTGQASIPQGQSCAELGSQCEAGTTCLSYYGIAGASGPLFKTCEIPCNGQCPAGQSCVTIADGPGQVCRAQ